MINFDKDSLNDIKNGSINIEKNNNIYAVIKNLVNENLVGIDFGSISIKDKKEISKFLYRRLCYFFDGFEKLKSFKVIKDIFYKS